MAGRSPTRVLVVDDDPLVRNLLIDQLEHIGFAVEAAAGGAEALALLERTAAFDLVLVDYMMPNMKGDEFARRAQAMNAGLKIAFMTGYDELLVLTGRGDRFPVIGKTARSAELSSLIDRLLREDQPGSGEEPEPEPAPRVSLAR